VIAKPLFSAFCEFKEVFYETMVEQGINENRRLLEQKIEETKNL